MFSSLRARLFSGFVLVIAMVLVISAVSLLLFVARSNLAARLDLRNTASKLFSRVELEREKFDDLNDLVHEIDENIGFRTVVVGPMGGVVADSRGDEEAGFPAFRKIPVDPFLETLNISDLDGKVWFYTGRQLPLGFALIVMEQRQPLRELVRSPISGELLRALAQSGTIAMVIALILAFLISRSVASPLRQISEASVQLAKGDKTYVEPQGPREVRRLGEAFNEMSAQVHASQQSQRDFVANVSHELKTPLTSVQGFAQAILDGTAGTPESRQKAAQVIYDESGRMYRMVLDLLDLAKLDAGTAELVMDDVSLDLLLDAVVERFAPQSAQAAVEVVSRVGSLPIVAGDGDRLAQVFNNLVENAIKHTPAGGNVTITSELKQGDVLVHVQDSGPGIPPEEAARIFERFYQLDKARKGGPSHSVGLGLAIASEIVQAHGGEISVKSEIGEGSVFTVRLPISHPDDGTLASMRARR